MGRFSYKSYSVTRLFWRVWRWEVGLPHAQRSGLALGVRAARNAARTAIRNTRDDLGAMDDA